MDCLDSMDEKNIKIWDEYWSAQYGSLGKEEAHCLFLAYLLLREFKKLQRYPAQSAIEMGAGAGRTSRYLNQMGLETGILDNSPEAIKLARYVNTELPHLVRFYCLDLLKIDQSSISEKYDITWNAGVLEHFSKKEQLEILQKMAEATSLKGLVILLTPYRYSFFYRLGKYVLEKIKRFPYGQEIPVDTLQDVIPSSLKLETQERSVGFLIFFFNGFKAISYLPGFSHMGPICYSWINKWTVYLLHFSLVRSLIFGLDRVLSRLLGGYLLLTVCTRR